MNCILIRLGLRPVHVERPRQEYLLALNWYYQTQNIRPLEDLLLDLYAIT